MASSLESFDSPREAKGSAIVLAVDRLVQTVFRYLKLARALDWQPRNFFPLFFSLSLSLFSFSPLLPREKSYGKVYCIPLLRFFYRFSSNDNISLRFSTDRKGQVNRARLKNLSPWRNARSFRSFFLFFFFFWIAPSVPELRFNESRTNRLIRMIRSWTAANER